MTMMRNLYVNGLTRSGYTNHRGSAMYSADGSIKVDKSRVKCHGCGRFGHFKNDCHANTAGRGKPRRVDTSTTKKTTARNRWCSFHNSTSHNDSECYKLKQLDGNNTMKPRAGNNKPNGNAHTAMARAWHKNGSDRKTQTQSHCVGNTMKPSAKRRNNGSDCNAHTAVHTTMQSDDEEYETEKHTRYAGTEYGYIPSEESTGFSFSTEAVEQTRKEAALKMRTAAVEQTRKEAALTMRAQQPWNRHARKSRRMRAERLTRTVSTRLRCVKSSRPTHGARP